MEWIYFAFSEGADYFLIDNFLLALLEWTYIFISEYFIFKEK